jgi:hypothetical protein
MALVRGREPGFDPAREALVARPLPGLASRAEMPPGRVTVLNYDDDEIVLDVDTPSAALLVTSELAYPGWVAWIDGHRTEVITANAAFRSVFVPSGSHEVRLAYRPLIVRVALILAIAGLLALILCVYSPGFSQGRYRHLVDRG